MVVEDHNDIKNLAEDIFRNTVGPLLERGVSALEKLVEHATTPPPLTKIL